MTATTDAEGKSVISDGASINGYPVYLWATFTLGNVECTLEVNPKDAGS